MQRDYEKERCAALVKEAHEVAYQLKCETESIERKVGSILEGDEDEPLRPAGATREAKAREERGARKSVWHFWS